jgi:hypothetical protein
VLSSWLDPDAILECAVRGKRYQRVPFVRAAPAEVDWARGVEDTASAVREGRPPRLSGRHAAHVLEVLCGVQASLENQRPARIRSGFEPPVPMEWAR